MGREQMGASMRGEYARTKEPSTRRIAKSVRRLARELDTLVRSDYPWNATEFDIKIGKEAYVRHLFNLIGDDGAEV